MKNTLHKCFSPVVIGLLFVGFIVIGLNSCKKESYTQTTTTDVNITGYLENNPEQFSLMSEIIDRAGAGYMQAYGIPGYTFFAPTNTAIKEWLTAAGKTTVSEVPVDDLKKMISYHVLADTVSTLNFTDGKIRQLTAYGQFLTSSTTIANGASFYVINKSAKIITPNVKVGNGLVHVIDKVLIPQTKTLAQLIEGNPRYSIFTQAMKETGLYNMLNTVQATGAISDRFKTAIVESDSAIKAVYPGGYSELKQRLSSKYGTNPTSQNDSLWLYVAYHIIPDAKYLPDIISSANLTTLAPTEVIDALYRAPAILLNEVNINNKVEPGAPINRTYSDITAANGALHEAKTSFRIVFRQPTGVFFDCGDTEGLNDQANYMKQNQQLNRGQSFFTPNVLMQRYDGQFSFIPFTGSNVANTATDGPIHNRNNFFNVALTSPPLSNVRTAWIDMKLPTIVKGRYKVWACYSVPVNQGAGLVQAVMDFGTPEERTLPSLMDYRNNNNIEAVSGVSLADPNADNLLEAQGYKRYMALKTETAVDATGKTINGDAFALNPKMIGRLMGTVTITTTRRHWIRFVGVTTNGSGSFYLDMVHLIPADNPEQQYPRFSKSGTAFKRP